MCHLKLSCFGILVLLSMTFALENGITCFKPGQCLDSMMLNLGPTKNAPDCLHKCQENEKGCEWFTFYNDSRNCISLTTCMNLTTEGCTDCISGEQECPEPVCNVNGRCIGALEGNQPADDLQACFQMCRDIKNCGWFSYDKANKICQVTADCPVLDKTCQDCVSSEGTCEAEDIGTNGMSTISTSTLLTTLPSSTSTISPKPEERLPLFVVGGVGSKNTAEIVDLSGEMKICPNVTKFLFAEHASIGTFIDNNAFICGGLGNKHCYNFDSEKNQWHHRVNLTDWRYGSNGILLNATNWWVTGGASGNKTEIYNSAANQFIPYVDLPKHDLSFHNLDSHIMLLGGVKPTNRSWMFNQIDESWNELPNTDTETMLTSAGLVTFDNGTRLVVVAGGSKTITTRGFDLEKKQWKKLPADLPVSKQLMGGASIQLEKTFLIVGGFDDVFTNNIIKFDTNTQKWTKMKEEMNHGRYMSTVFTVPEDYAKCY